jgi:lysine decarboxylase/arginine decarboxylase
MKLDKREWPVLIVSSQFEAYSDEGSRLRELITQLTEVQECAVLTSLSYEDALHVFFSRADLGALVIDWDIPEDANEEKRPPDGMLHAVRSRNPHIPVVLLTDKWGLEDLTADELKLVNDCIWKTSDTVEFLSGRINTLVKEYMKSVLPPFFGELSKYAREYKYAWHTPGHMGGQGFLRSPAGVAMHKFFGENVFRADLSISVPELGSLLDHSGPVRDAEDCSAKAFGSDITFYVLNGTSNVNQIIWRSQVLRDDIAFVDRNCHKSLNYAMVITEAYPIYMTPRRNKRGIIGPVRLSEFSEETIRAKIAADSLIPDELKDGGVKMSALTNSTYDGLCYNVVNIKKELKKSVENLHFDEAWYAYARFHPIYKNHYGMADDEVNKEHPPIFCSQSTHKLLTAFSQASMLHVKNGSHTDINQDELNESYMMHGSTSPQYNMIASLDVATKMMADNGQSLLSETILEAVHLRRKVAKMAKDMADAGDWFFDMWQPKKVKYKKKFVNFHDVDCDYLANNQQPWVLSSENNWHGFDDIEDDYVMLDPIKLTFTTPGLDEDGTMQPTGIPASVVTNYLIRHRIVCEKTDYYSFLLLNSLGTTRAKQGALLSGLLGFKALYDDNAPLREAMPDLYAASPKAYEGVGLKEHCQGIHEHFRDNDLLGLMQAAFQVIPDQAMKPADAYHEVVRKNVEYVELDAMFKQHRIPAVMLVPYPPGIPVIMGGEILNEKAKPIFDYLKARQAFENKFPGYESDIHGVERDSRDGKQFFKTLCIKES